MQCSYIKPDGSQCWANTLEGSRFCWFHAPEIDYDRTEARKKGGTAKREGIYTHLPAIPLKTPEDVPELIMDTIRQVRGGFISARLGLAVGYLAVKFLKSHETLKLGGKINKLESEIEKLKKPKRKRIKKAADKKIEKAEN